MLVISPSLQDRPQNYFEQYRELQYILIPISMESSATSASMKFYYTHIFGRGRDYYKI